MSRQNALAVEDVPPAALGGPGRADAGVWLQSHCCQVTCASGLRLPLSRPSADQMEGHGYSGSPDLVWSPVKITFTATAVLLFEQALTQSR
jgi:hypothetical protein